MRERLSASWRAPALESLLCIHPASERTLSDARTTCGAALGPKLEQLGLQARTALPRCAQGAQWALRGTT